MTLKGRYGISRWLISKDDYIFAFYMFDVPVLSTTHLLGLNPPGSFGGTFRDFLLKYQLFIKGVILMIMTIESLASHTFGPGTRKKVSKCQDESQMPFKSPLRKDDGDKGPAASEAMGLVHKEKES